MTRRRRTREAPIETLFKAPWWISVALGIFVLVALKWIEPPNVASSAASSAVSNAILKPLASMLSGLAWLLSGVFFFIGLLSLVREKLSAPKPAKLADWQSTKSAAGTQADGGWQSRVAQYGVQGRAEPKQDRVLEAWEASIAGVSSTAKSAEWSIELLRDLEWKRFEDVCQKFYALKGIKSETTPLGPDGGIDIRLYQDSADKPTSIVQCKAWGERNVGIKPVRELLGVMAHEKIEKACFMASGNFTEEAKAFAQSNHITLINGEMLLAMIRRLPESDRQTLLVFATDGDFRTPTCPSCGIKMRRVSGTNGRPDFWGCHNYPRCRQKLRVRAAERY
ncbi:Restriction endonuclease [Sterolibacterium denitrificans]|uniref:Restriction endonuclease n=1 Tax=Sterolibacterium denitrificans TaxID=157592 RepID=A0A7Z7HQ75_9PROT|nr:restriction endonuclease [Sterolibacterium denitrificans]SMB24455.1 Restriction endonuclease [Sterolibacterium denitrificans]